MRVATCTDIKQSWGHVKKDVEEKFSAKKLSELCCVNVIPRQILTSAQQDQDNLAAFMKGKLLKCIYENVSCLCCCLIAAAPHSALALHAKKRHALCQDTLPNIVTTAAIFSKMFSNVGPITATALLLEEGALKDFYLSAVRVQKDQIENIERKTRLQNNNVWKHERALRITASRAHELFTYKGQSWDLKISKFLTPSKYKSAAMVYGSKTEECARMCYASMRKCKVMKVGFVIDAEQPWLGCSPDGYVAEQSRLLEIKCPFNGKSMTLSEMLKTVKYLDENLDLKQNHSYFTQVQISMAVCKINVCDFILYSKYDNKCHITTISLNVEFVKNIVNKLNYIYFTKLLPVIFEKS